MVKFKRFGILRPGIFIGSYFFVYWLRCLLFIIIHICIFRARVLTRAFFILVRIILYI